MLWLLLSSAFAVDIPITSPTSGFDDIRFQFGGFAQPRFTYTPDDESVGVVGTLGFSVRRVRLETKLDMLSSSYPDVRTKVSLELMPEARLVDAYIEVDIIEAVQIRFGQQKSASNRSLMVSDRNTLFPERGALQELVPRREMGMVIRGDSPKGILHYSVGVFNGEGTNRLANVNRKFMYVARAVLSPFGSEGTKTELMDVQDDSTISFGYAFHLNEVGPEGQQEGTYGHNLSLFGHWKWFTLQGEYLFREIDWEDINIADYTQGGWYLQLGSFLPFNTWSEKHLAAMARIEEIDEFDALSQDVPLVGPTDPGQRRRNISMGIGYYAGSPFFAKAQDFRIQLVYTLRSELEGFEYNNDTLQFAAHLSF